MTRERALMLIVGVLAVSLVAVILGQNRTFRIPSANDATARLHRRSIEWALLLYGRRLSNKRNRVLSSSSSIRACCGNRLSGCG